FVARVDASGGAFVEGAALAGGESRTLAVPAQPAQSYEDALGAAMAAALEETGLYRDEAQAMVATWRRQWFKAPGLRALYLIPQALVDEQIPLRLDPRPDTIVRTMVIRVEALTPELEGADARAAERLAQNDNTEAISYYKNLGRFGEPRLRRAM